jgi:hypothetical protein
MSGWVAGATVLTGAYGAHEAGKASKAAAAGTERTAAEAAALSTERFGEARELMEPYIGEARTAREQQMIEMGLAPGEAGTAYMETPGYQSLLEERRREAEQAAAVGGGLYSGRRIQAAADVGGATQSQFYQNYMNMLQNLGSPAVATNLAGLGMGQAATLGAQDIAAQQAASRQRVAGAESQQAFLGDVMGGAANIAGSYLATQPAGPVIQPATAAYGDAYQPARQAGYI